MRVPLSVVGLCSAVTVVLSCMWVAAASPARPAAVIAALSAPALYVAVSSIRLSRSPLLPAVLASALAALASAAAAAGVAVEGGAQSRAVCVPVLALLSNVALSSAATSSVRTTRALAETALDPIG